MLGFCHGLSVSRLESWIIYIPSPSSLLLLSLCIPLLLCSIIFTARPTSSQAAAACQNITHSQNTTHSDLHSSMDQEFDCAVVYYIKQLSPSDAASSKQIKLPKTEARRFCGDLRHKQRSMVVSWVSTAVPADNTLVPAGRSASAPAAAAAMPALHGGEPAMLCLLTM